MFPGSLTPVLTQLSLQSHRLLFSHASAEVTGEKTLERKIDSTGYQTYNHQVLSPTSVHEKKLAEVQNRDSSFSNLSSLNGLICQGFAYLFSTQSQLLMTMKKKPFENIVGKEENAGNQHFLLFLQCSLFYPEKKLPFGSPLICRLQMLWIWTGLKIFRLVKSSMVRDAKGWN